MKMSKFSSYWSIRYLHVAVYNVWLSSHKGTGHIDKE
jgi:hypothetical protein